MNVVKTEFLTDDDSDRAHLVEVPTTDALKSLRWTVTREEGLLHKINYRINSAWPKWKSNT